MKKKFVIIGASGAGISCANRIRHLDTGSEIICISDENENPYNKCMLADYLCGTKTETEVFTLSIEQARQKNITLLLGKRVVQINPDQKNIRLNDGSSITYDALLLGVGTSPRLPQLEYNQSSNCFTFHRLRDINGIMQFIKATDAKRAVVVGSGLSGLECADALQTQGLQVNVVELQERVLQTHVDVQGSAFIQRAMRNMGITFYAQSSVAKLSIAHQLISQLILHDGTCLPADIVVFAIGLHPNLELAQSAGISIQDGGIVTNEYMQSSIPYIYAAGDIALVHDQLADQKVLSRTWPDAMLQGLVAAHSMVGQPKKYPGIAAIISSSFFGIKFASCGPVVNPPAVYEKIVSETAEFYHLFLMENDLLKGFLLVGNTAMVGKLRQLVLSKATTSKEYLFSL